MKRVAILQSCYIPWKGYFDMIASVDEFIFYDDMQYTRRDWRNRNTIKTANGPIWLTVPVQVKGKFDQKIRETKIDGTEWIDKHWKTITQNYRRAQFFSEVEEFLKPLYFDRSYQTISDLNHEITGAICARLGIVTTLSRSWDYTLIDGKTERLVDLCIQSGATEYTSGPAARNYIDENLFREAGIKLTWFDYSGYEPYPQLWGEFQHSVSIIDLLFNCGDRAREYMKYVPAPANI